jgi:flagellar hook-basal body complex protein FliE
MSEIDVNQILSQMRALRAAAQGVPQETPSAAGPAEDFGSLLKQSIDKVNEAQASAGELRDRFVAGDPNTDITDVMVALQKASLSFQAMTQVRNRLVSAYQDIMNMQV